MCGIFGLLNIKFRTDYFQEKIIKEQFEKGKGRGPEDSVLKYFGLDTLLGFHRLAINGLNSNSNQPLTLGNVTLICNGEIYNYKELYNILEIEPDTDSDCEVILHLYIRFGIERTLQMLDGVFALILLDYDIHSNCIKLYAARDPYGVRPLYILHSEQDKIYGFASEMKCLSSFGDESYIISHLKPGTYQKYTQSHQVSSDWLLESTDNRYHIPSIITTYYNHNSFNLDQSYYQTYIENIDNILKRIQKSLICAVEKRCTTTERPIACLLSGGLDSSLITALVNDYHKKMNLPILETYSIGLKDSVDLYYAKIVAEHLGTKHTEIILDESDFLNAIPDVIYAIESYDTTSIRASIGNYLLGKYISENSQAKVIFNGDGSDELTGGYLYFHKSPNSIEFDLECRRLLGDIYMYDVLRSDKCISTHGLEPRTPFLDREFVQTYLEIPSLIRNHSKNSVSEKYLLRSAFDDYLNMYGDRLLPKEIIWRTKEAFSDGVSKKSRSLYEIIQDYVINHIQKDKNIDLSQNIHNPPKTAEQVYYRELFESYFPRRGYIVPYMWMPRFIEGVNDASARTLSIYSEINKPQEDNSM